jgi:hypothetical protein
LERSPRIWKFSSSKRCNLCVVGEVCRPVKYARFDQDAYARLLPLNAFGDHAPAAAWTYFNEQNRKYEIQKKTYSAEVDSIRDPVTLDATSLTVTRMELLNCSRALADTGLQQTSRPSSLATTRAIIPSHTLAGVDCKRRANGHILKATLSNRMGRGRRGGGGAGCQA